jgi:hypothetical protein
MFTARTANICADRAVSWDNRSLIEIVAQSIIPRGRNILFLVAIS